MNPDSIQIISILNRLDSLHLNRTIQLAAKTKINGQAIRNLMLESIEYRLGKPKIEEPIQCLSENGNGYTAVTFGKSLGQGIRTTALYSSESNGIYIIKLYFFLSRQKQLFSEKL